MNGGGVMRCKNCVSCSFFLLQCWENDRAALAGREIARAKESSGKTGSCPFSHFLPPRSHAAVGATPTRATFPPTLHGLHGHPHPPWEHRGVNPGVKFHLSNM